MTTGRRQTIRGRYWNANGKGMCIMAAVTSGIDWAAYIGTDDGWNEEHCMKWAEEYGAKLSSEDAKHFFPDIALPYRR